MGLEENLQGLMETAWPLTRIDVGLSPHTLDVMVTSQVLSSYEAGGGGKGQGSRSEERRVGKEC